MHVSDNLKENRGEEGGGEVMREDEEDIKRGGENRKKKTNSGGPDPGTHKPVRSTGFMV